MQVFKAVREFVFGIAHHIQVYLFIVSKISFKIPSTNLWKTHSIQNILRLSLCIYQNSEQHTNKKKTSLSMNICISTSLSSSAVHETNERETRSCILAISQQIFIIIVHIFVLCCYVRKFNPISSAFVSNLSHIKIKVFLTIF